VGRASTEPITVLGNVNVDLIVASVVEIPPPGEERVVGAIDMRAGGAAGNAALTLAALGRRPRTVSRVGDDAFGSFLLASMEAGHVDTRDVGVAPQTGTCVSIAFEAPGRDRSFLISPGSLDTIGPAAIPPATLHARHLLLCGYFLLPRLRGPVTTRLLEEVRTNGGTTWFDPGWDPAGWSEATRMEVRSLLPLVDVFLPNEQEATALTGEPDARRAAAILHRLSGGWVVVKLGARGCVGHGPGDREVEAGAPRVDVVDTTGAGDAFNAGYIAAVTDGAGPQEAVVYATRVASTVVSRPSANRYPTSDEVLHPA
jgi:sugar/nucleoside kinase (ribokinase family)